jgi:excinuclease ABC subunit A
MSNIVIKGAREHNLCNIDLVLPRNKLICFTGVSGSGKSSLAFDTLYAEGQRRYIETFSASLRQFLEKLEKPDVESIDGLPPAVAVTAKSYRGATRSTVGTVTEITDYLAVLFTKIGIALCPNCSREIKIDTPSTILHDLKKKFPNENKKIQMAFAPPLEQDQAEFETIWKEQGFVRGMIFGTPFRFDGGEAGNGIPTDLYEKAKNENLNKKSCLLLVDRLTLGISEDERIIDSLETAMEYGDGACVIVTDAEHFAFSRLFSCETCGTAFPNLEPQLFSFNHPKGACPSCEGTGKRKNVTEKETGGRKKESTPRVSGGNDSRNSDCCPDCSGGRLRREVRNIKIASKNIVELSEMKISELSVFFKTLELTQHEQKLSKTPLEQIQFRLDFLQQTGLSYLTLSRSMSSLSGGEQRRINLTSVLGSSLVDMLYVLDEPSAGLHPADTDKLIKSIQQLHQRGNTVIVVEHEEAFLRAAEHIVEIGCGAGKSGGKIVFQGTVQELCDHPNSVTGKYLSRSNSSASSNSSSFSSSSSRQPPTIELIGCNGNNLKDLSVSFPLGVLCVVSGVSGAGKSTLVQKTLYPALCQYFGTENNLKPLPFERLIPCNRIDNVMMVDQHPIGHSPRSNPVTYLKIFDEIRHLFASTLDAQAKNLTAGHFSFNIDGGRCGHCQGDGYVSVDMQFLPEMLIRCSECRGKRYRSEVLEILYRGRNIAEILEMTVREAFVFFRGQGKVQQKLKRLLDVGLDYLQLGQPANTLSGGESQRLKLAAHLAQLKKGRSLILMDEPTTGLHFADIEWLLGCFRGLIETGHSLIVVEHNLQMIRAADYLIDLGPGAADNGGNIVAQGTPQEVAAEPHSLTGIFLK